MGTKVEITVVSEEGRGSQLVAKAFREIERLESIFSEWRSDSEVSAVNRMAGKEAVRVGSEILELIKRSLYFSRESNGAFDITWAALRHVWDFSQRSPRVPEKKEIENLLRLVDYRKIIIDEPSSTVFLKEKGMEIGLGGIAKGYIVGKAAAFLRSNGAQGGLINAGGNMESWGSKENGEAWTIGIQHPREMERLLGVLKITEGSISTSGDYERYFIVEGKRYHHIINPRTGFPSEGCEAVTVLCSNPTDADAVSTTAFILGPKKGLKFIEDMGCEGLIVDKKENVKMTKGMKELIQGR